MNYSQFLKSKKDITNWLDSRGVKSYELVEDREYGFKVNCKGEVNLEKELGERPKYLIEYFPVKFGIVEGNFYCDSLGLKSLVGAPDKIIGGDFSANSNELTSLLGGPTEMGFSYGVNCNQLTSLEGAPEIIYGEFDCGSNNLSNLIGGPKDVRGLFYFSYNPINTLQGCPQIVGANFIGNKNRAGGLKNLEFFPEFIKGSVRLDGQVGDIKLNNIDTFEDMRAIYLQEVARKQINLEKESLQKLLSETAFQGLQIQNKI